MDQSDVVYVIELVEKESVLSKRVAALELAVKNLTASNKQRAQCPNLWHDGLHDGCGICPDCGEAF